MILHVGLGLHTTVALECEHAHGELRRALKHSHPGTECFGLGQNSIFLMSFQLQVLEMASLPLGILFSVASPSVQHFASEISNPFTNTKELTFSTLAGSVQVIIPILHTRCLNADISPRSPNDALPKLGNKLRRPSSCCFASVSSLLLD